LENQGNTAQAEDVLARGVAAYPYSGALVARLALRYAADGKAWKGLLVVEQYRKVFPEDPAVRLAQQRIDAGSNTVTPAVGSPATGASPVR
jgi:hypothetical protein